MYKYLRNLLFLLPEEVAHVVSMYLLSCAPKFIFKQPNADPVECMGIKFPHRIGLAAGFDKNASYLKGLAKLGFAFIEVGTVTPRPQPGNPRPRLFRLFNSRALINRMGFNNYGVDKLVMNIKNSGYKGILGVNIGKNKDTPLKYADADYIYCMRRVYKYADYLTINISSPNTQDLRKLQLKSYLDNFIGNLCLEHNKLCLQYTRYVPLAIKVSPDETEETIKNLAQVALKYNIDAIIATNTSNSRENLFEEINRSLSKPAAESKLRGDSERRTGLCTQVHEDSSTESTKQVSSFALGFGKRSHESGGLSGEPILDRANKTLATLHNIVGDKIDLIGVGGVHDKNSANSKLKNGAKLIQVYTGLIYHGPSLLR